MKIEEAKLMGKQAFELGIKSAPCLDKDFMKKLAEIKDRPLGYSIHFMEAWSQGWHEMNLKKGSK